MPQTTPLHFTMPDITGKDVDLASYHGKAVLIVNVASRCGLTPQYTALEALHRDKHERGLVILGFPANNFGAQEPGSNEQIQTFCRTSYDVTFPMFAKVSVKGEDICPLYAHLTDATTNPGFSGEITWNFEKFLIGRDGRVVARFAPGTTPDDPAVTQAVDAALAGA